MITECFRSEDKDSQTRAQDVLRWGMTVWCSAKKKKGVPTWNGSKKYYMC